MGSPTARVTGEGPKTPLEQAQAAAEHERLQLAVVTEHAERLAGKGADRAKLKDQEAVVAAHKARAKAAEQALTALKTED